MGTYLESSGNYQFPTTILVDVEESFNDFGERVLWEVSFFEGVAPTGVCQDFFLIILSQLPVVRPGSHFHILVAGSGGRRK